MILLIDDMLTKLLQPTTLTMRWVLHSAAAFEDSPIFCGPSGCLGRAGGRGGGGDSESDGVSALPSLTK